MADKYEKILIYILENKLESMSISEYKIYVLSFLFYRYLSEKQERYLIENNVIDVDSDKSINDAYAMQANSESLNDFLEDISLGIGYAITPFDTWETLVSKIENNEIVPSNYQTAFDSFNKNTKLKKGVEKNFQGIFDDVNLNDIRLGKTTTERAQSLNKIVKIVSELDYGNDIIGLFKSLIEEFALSSGKVDSIK